MIDWIKNHAWDSFLYDFIKFCLAYFVSRWLYEDRYKSWKYGGWSVVLINTVTGEERREIAPAWAEKILKDKHDFSLYIKSFISPFFHLNMDISDQKAIDLGLIKIDHNNKLITIDQEKNPPRVSTQTNS